MVSVRHGGGQCRSRLLDGSGQFERGQLGHDVAGAYGVTFVHLNGRKLAADLGRHADLGRAHDADDGRRYVGTPQRISARAGHDENHADRDNGYGPVSHVFVSA